MHQECLISLVLSVHNKHTYKPKYHAAHLLKICYHIKTYETLTGQKYLENIYDWYDNNNKKERKKQPPFHFFFKNLFLQMMPKNVKIDQIQNRIYANITIMASCYDVFSLFESLDCMLQGEKI